jgi:hypothetical protein
MLYKWGVVFGSIKLCLHTMHWHGRRCQTQLHHLL